MANISQRESSHLNPDCGAVFLSANVSRRLLVSDGSLQTHPAFKGSSRRGGLAPLLATFTFHSLGCVNEDNISQLIVMLVRNLSTKRMYGVKDFSETNQNIRMFVRD